MTSIIRSVLSILLGLTLAIYGLVHTANRYPDPATFARLVDALPTLGAVLLFAAGIAAVAAGMSLLFVSVRRLRQAWRHLRHVAGFAEPRRVPAGRPYDGPNGNGYHDADEREWAGAYR